MLLHLNYHPSLSGNILLYNIKTSKLLSTMGCKYITAIRTGAVALITIKYLAKKDFRKSEIKLKLVVKYKDSKDSSCIHGGI